MTFAVIENGVVVNVIVADQSFIDRYYPGAPCIDNLSPGPGIGWTYDGTLYHAPVQE